MPLPVAPLPDGLSPDVEGLLTRAHGSASLAEGMTFARQGFDLAAAHGDQREMAAAGHLYCFFLFRTGEIVSAIEIGEPSLPRLRSEGLQTAYAETLRWIGLCACDSGRFDIAIKYATEAFGLTESSGDKGARVLAFSLLGSCFERSGDPWQGERVLRDGLNLARDLGETYPLVATLNNLGAILIGKFYSLRDGASANEARQALEASLPLAREAAKLAPVMNDPYFNAFVDGNLGEILVHLGQFDEADQLLSRSLAAARANGYHAVSSRVRCSMAELRLARGDTVGAKQLLHEVLPELGSTQLVATELRAYFALYLAHRADGEASEALRALETFRRIENQRTLQQLRARSEFMVTRVEADESQRKGLERAYGVAQAHASRAVALERMTMEDELTGLGNRRALDMMLPDIVTRTANATQPLTVVVVDLDHFKRVNDLFGHATGDRVLVQIAKLLSERTRPGDLVARTGGEEFVLVLPGLSRTDAFEVCDRLRLRVSEFQWGAIAPELRVTISLGIACAPVYDAASLVERADLAMYRAKRSGRNRVAVAT